LKKGPLLGRGRTADVYAWGDGCVLKLYRSWMPRARVEKEYLATQAAQAAGVPVPNTYELVQLEGRHGIVFEKIEGITLLNELQMKPWKLLAISRKLGELHTQIHHSYAPVELSTQRQLIENGIEAATDIIETDKQLIRSYLMQLPDGEFLCHGDFHPDNIILSASGPIIIDWLTATRGDPSADLARTSLLLKTSGLSDCIPTHVRILFNIFRNLLHAMYLRRYLQLCPDRREQIEMWRLPLITARLREVEDYPQEKKVLLAQLNTLLMKQAQ
jgi:aminoglycoside phosphotransferase (APT) family kinase protein